MKPATATLCLLSGLALVLLGIEGSTDRGTTALTKRLHSARNVCAAIGGTLAVVTLVEHALDVGFGIDRLLSGRTVGLPLGRTAASFLLISAAVLSIDHLTPRGHSPAQLFAFAAGSIAFMALLGFAFRLPVLHSPTPRTAATGMALHTALSIVLLSVGLLLARPRVGFVSALTSRYAGGLASRRLMLGLLGFAPVAILVITGRNLGWYGEHSVAPMLVLLALLEGAVLILITAIRLNAYDLRQRTIEALLRESQQRIHQLIGLAPDGIFIADLEGRYTDVNDAGCRLLGLPREEIIGKTIADFLPEEQIPLLWELRQRLMEGQVVPSEWMVRHRSGVYVPVEVATAILPDGRWQGVVRDISERKRTEAALDQARETDRQLRAELEMVMGASTSVSEAVADLPGPDVTAVLQTIALQAQTMTGAEYVAVGLGTDPERPFDPWVVLGFPPETAKRIGRHPRPIGTLGEVPRTGTSLRVPDLRRLPTFRGFPPGHPEMTSLLGVPIRYHGRSMGNLYLANKRNAVEFTEQDQRMVEMLAARAAIAIETANLYTGEALQRAWLSNIFDQMPEGVLILDAGSRVVTTNHAVLAFAGGSSETPFPRDKELVLNMCLPDGRPIDASDLPAARALRDGQASVGVELAVRKDDRLVPVLTSAAPIRDDAGRITGATVLIQDITPLKELDRLREEWASLVAHDLRQPVNAISLSAESLARSSGAEVPEKDRRTLERIRSAATRLNRMIDDLLEASRIEARRLSISPQTFDLGALIAAAAESMRETVGHHEVRVTAAPGQLAWIDPDRVQQVLTNLVGNAAKYGDPGTEIFIETASRDDVFEVSVTNHGPGIPPEELPRLFSRFGRTAEARASGKPGTGLGLYIAKGLIEAHGGRIWVDSMPGELTTFHFIVPRAHPAASPTADAGAPTQS